MAENALEIAGAEPIQYYFRNYDYSSMLSDLPILSLGFEPTLERLLYKNSDGTKMYKIMSDASTTANLTDDRVMVTTGGGKANVSTITSADLFTLDGINGNVQNQLDLKLALAPDYIDLNTTLLADPAYKDGRFFYDKTNHTLAFYSDIEGPIKQIGLEIWKRVKNNTGSPVLDGKVVYVNGQDGGISTVALAKADVKETCTGTIGLATHDIGIGEEGWITTLGAVNGLVTTGMPAGTIVHLSDTVAGECQMEAPSSPSWHVKIGTIGIEDAVVGTVDVHVEVGTNQRDVIQYYNGAFLTAREVKVLSPDSGATVVATLEAPGGGDVYVFFGGEIVKIVCTPKLSVTLTAGTIEVPVRNYVYILKSNPVELVSSTVDWPAAEHSRITDAYVQSAIDVFNNEVYKNHEWTDHLTSGDGQGHSSDINFWIRQQHATYISGIGVTITGSGTNNIALSNDPGIALQLHPHTVPAFASPARVLVVNDFITKYNPVTNLGITTDALGVSLVNKTFACVLWVSVSEEDSQCKWFLNKPTGFYLNEDDTRNDSLKYTDYSIPISFRGTAVLVHRLVMKYSSGIWTVYLDDSDDLRGTLPNATAGGTVGSGAQTLGQVLVTGSSANNLGINDLLDPVLIQDAATKGYVDTSIGLVPIDEGNGIGFHLLGDDRANKGNLGLNAVDLSINSVVSTTHGATGDLSHAEGQSTISSGESAHAEGRGVTASGGQSHAEGLNTTASGLHSHSEGFDTVAGSDSSHAEGDSNKILATAPAGAHIEGQYAIDSTTNQQSVIGIGTGDLTRKNGRVMWTDGTMELPEATDTLNVARGAKAVVIQEQLDALPIAKNTAYVNTSADYKTAAEDINIRIIWITQPFTLSGTVEPNDYKYHYGHEIIFKNLILDGNSLGRTLLFYNKFVRIQENVTFTAGAGISTLKVLFDNIIGADFQNSLNYESEIGSSSIPTNSIRVGWSNTLTTNGVSTGLTTSDDIATNFAIDANLASVGAVKDYADATKSAGNNNINKSVTGGGFDTSIMSVSTGSATPGAEVGAGAIVIDTDTVSDTDRSFIINRAGSFIFSILNKTFLIFKASIQDLAANVALIGTATITIANIAKGNFNNPTGTSAAINAKGEVSLEHYTVITNSPTPTFDGEYYEDTGVSILGANVWRIGATNKIIRRVADYNPGPWLSWAIVEETTPTDYSIFRNVGDGYFQDSTLQPSIDGSAYSGNSGVGSEGGTDANATFIIASNGLAGNFEGVVTTTATPATIIADDALLTSVGAVALLLAPTSVSVTFGTDIIAGAQNTSKSGNSGVLSVNMTVQAAGVSAGYVLATLPAGSLPFKETYCMACGDSLVQVCCTLNTSGQLIAKQAMSTDNYYVATPFTVA